MLLLFGGLNIAWGLQINRHRRAAESQAFRCMVAHLPSSSQQCLPQQQQQQHQLIQRSSPSRKPEIRQGWQTTAGLQPCTAAPSFAAAIGRLWHRLSHVCCCFSWAGLNCFAKGMPEDVSAAALQSLTSKLLREWLSSLFPPEAHGRWCTKPCTRHNQAPCISPARFTMMLSMHLHPHWELLLVQRCAEISEGAQWLTKSMPLLLLLLLLSPCPSEAWQL